MADRGKQRRGAGCYALKKGDPARAETLFEDKQWQGSAQYNAQDYAAAATSFAQTTSADGLYNLSNALARQQQYEKAIKAYDQAITLDTDNEDARFNKQLVEKLLASAEQQKQQKQPAQQDSGQQNQEAQDEQETADQKQDGEPSQQPAEQSQAPEESSAQQDIARQAENQTADK